MYLLLELIGVILGSVGSLFLLIEPVELRLEQNGHLAAFIPEDMKDYRNRLLKRRIGVLLLAVGFFLQIIAIAGQMTI